MSINKVKLFEDFNSGWVTDGSLPEMKEATELTQDNEHGPADPTAKISEECLVAFKEKGKLLVRIGIAESGTDHDGTTTYSNWYIDGWEYSVGHSDILGWHEIPELPGSFK